MADNQDISDNLINAVCFGRVEVVRELINTYGLSYSDAWSEGYNLLCHALSNEQRIVANILLNYNCQVNSKNSRCPEDTPLNLAVKNGYIEIVKMLLNKGADIKAIDEYGETPLHCAVYGEYYEIVEFLLSKEVDVNATNNNGETPLHCAALSQYYEVVELILKHKPDVNVKDRCGRTPLHLAVLSKYYEVVELLLKHKADIEAKDEYGETPLHYAIENKKLEIVELLLEHFADVNVTNNRGATPLKIAISFDTDKRTPLVKALIRHIVKLKTANLYICKENLILMENICGEINDLKNKCEEEILRMRSKKFYDSKVSFYDILTKLHKNTPWMRNKKIVEGLTTEDYKTEFPIYANMISNQFRRGMERNEFLKQKTKIFLCLFNDVTPQLNDECIEKLLNYLRNEDIQNIEECINSNTVNKNY